MCRRITFELSLWRRAPSRPVAIFLRLSGAPGVARTWSAIAVASSYFLALLYAAVRRTMVVASGVAALSTAILNSVMATSQFLSMLAITPSVSWAWATKSFWMPVHCSSVSLGFGFAAALTVGDGVVGQFGGALHFFVLIQVEFLGDLRELSGNQQHGLEVFGIGFERAISVDDGVRASRPSADKLPRPFRERWP